MSYAVYGKRRNWRNPTNGRWNEGDSRFAALNGNGERVSRLADALVFYEKEDAEAWIASHTWMPEATLEIRKVKD